MTEVVSPFWKSSYSGQENACVAVADTAAGGRAVRDSKQQDGPLLTVSRDGWQAFLRQFA
ncbi:DUF397 domain-containing protein [Streptomyces coelicoflavus]|uniref:DUF397 domain-containing protein n=1 Tax=Streptomyces coelicoflavus TaxID=285562 RepID=UPI0024AE5C44|nr:DUF397 domain-containing protein [Streptomyces coelicoflavus]MDI6518752.1 DUF397 domain-containing protein [Streptomyces coelicoflavus]